MVFFYLEIIWEVVFLVIRSKVMRGDKYLGIIVVELVGIDSQWDEFSYIIYNLWGEMVLLG